MGALDRIFRGRRSSQRTIPQQVAAALKRYDAHLYLPGPGGVTVQSFRPGNYVESTGVTPGSVDGLVGLVLDAAGSVGPEIIATGNLIGFSDSTAAVAHTDTGFTTTSNAVGVTKSVLTVGKTYRLVISGTATQELTVNTADSLTPTVRTQIRAGFGECTFVADKPVLYLRLTLAGSVSGLAISVREVTGIHASQVTQGYKPTLRRAANGKYYWQFDGSDDRLVLGSVPFQMSDDHCVIAAATCGDASTIRSIFDSRSTTLANPLVANLITGSSGQIAGRWRDDAGTALVVVNAGSVSTGETFVASLRKVGNTKVARKNGVQGGSDTTALGVSSANSATIGATIGTTMQSYFNGAIYPTLAIKGTVSDADLKLFEKWIGSLAGVTL